MDLLLGTCGKHCSQLCSSCAPAFALTTSRSTTVANSRLFAGSTHGGAVDLRKASSTHGARTPPPCPAGSAGRGSRATIAMKSSNFGINPLLRRSRGLSGSHWSPCRAYHRGSVTSGRHTRNCDRHSWTASEESGRPSHLTERLTRGARAVF